MPASSSWLLARQRLAVLRILGQRLQGARLPVDPGRVALLGRRSSRRSPAPPAASAACRRRRAARRAPSRPACRRASSSSRCPWRRRSSARWYWSDASGSSFIAACRATLAQAQAARSARQRASPSGRRACRRPLRCRWRPGGSAPAWPARRRLRVAADAFLREVARRAVERARRRVVADRRAEQRRGLARRARPVRLDRQARLAPDVGCASSCLASNRAAPSRAQPSSASRLRQPGGDAPRPATSLAGELLGEQRVAGDLAVVVHAKARELGGEVGPVAAPAELEQPVVAQAVFDVGAAPALVERVELGLLRLGRGGCSAPSSRPRSPADWPRPAACARSAARRLRSLLRSASRASSTVSA